MSEKIKVVQSEPVEVVDHTEKKSYKKLAIGVALGALAAIAAAVAYSKLSNNGDDFDEDEIIWSPMPEAPEAVNNQ